MTRGRVTRVILDALTDADELARTDVREASGPRIVAVSGGLDSCVLLHVLRFAARDRFAPDDRVQRPVAAHFDHRMRAGSESDARWVRGVCRAWGVELRLGRAGDVTVSEADARARRYRFLEEVRHAYGEGARVLTAHHADDQAETVLFRALRGTGIDGLAGIRRTRAPGIVRPMMDLWREELESYASAVGLRWREDPTNEHLGYARNRLRHELIPSIERDVAPGARAALVRLSRVAAGEGAAWRDALEVVLGALDARTEPGGSWSVDATGFGELGRGLRARVLRSLVGRCGYRSGWSAIDRALDFLASTQSGRAIDVGGGTFIGRELERVVVGRREEARAARETSREESLDAPLTIESSEAGEGTAIVGERSVRVRWGLAACRDDIPRASSRPRRRGFIWTSFLPENLAFPLVVRGRGPGDRLASARRRKVKTVLLEARIPRAERDRVPLLCDARGRVLWIPSLEEDTRFVSARAATGGTKAAEASAKGASEEPRAEERTTSTSHTGALRFWVGISG